MHVVGMVFQASCCASVLLELSHSLAVIFNASLEHCHPSVSGCCFESLIAVDPNFSIMVLKFKKWIFLKLCLFLDP